MRKLPKNVENIWLENLKIIGILFPKIIEGRSFKSIEKVQSI